MRVLLALVGGFAVGIFFRSLVPFGWPVIGFVFVLAALFVVAAFHTPRKSYWLIAGFFLFAALGAARMQLSDAPLPRAFLPDIGRKVSYEGTVVGNPDVRDANQHVIVAVSKDGDATRIMAYADRYPEFSADERVRVTGELAVPEAFADEDGRVFRYDKYLQKDGVRFTVMRATLTSLSSAPWWSVPAALAHVKNAFLNALARVLPEPYASLGGGIVIGGKQGLGADLLNAFVTSGLVQIIVLSGYNVMLVANAVMNGFARLKLPKRAAALVGGGVVVLFVLVAGAGSASIRAGLMAVIALYARATGRSYTASRALFAAIVLMLLWNPLLLAFDPGFELSVAATAGIIWLSPLFEKYLMRFKPLAASAFWRMGIATTLAAQLAVLPLIIYETGTLSWVAFPANVIALPVIPWTMGASALAGFAALAFGRYALPFALPAYLLTYALAGIARLSAALPFAALQLPQVPFWLVALAYAFMAYAAHRAYAKAAVRSLRTAAS
ncbi:MAG: ComEC/Rec2 family competence protein [Patescibacteria group bacterium]|nr:ComEC/Rec2 family competence protein [Patescibacteria group bacterium]MDE1966044.1 ComEC/Rec2 family competence protein [Patescibacteria group bacterium]